MWQYLKDNGVFWLCTIIAVVLLIASFIVPPRGVIDPSVLAGVGELFAFAALGAVVNAIGKGIDAKVTHNGTSIEIINDNDNADNGTL